MSLTIFSDPPNSASWPDNALRQRTQLDQFLSFFPNRHGSLVKRNKGSWRTTSQYHSLSDDEILQSLSTDSPLKRACSFDSTTRFAVIHVPLGSCFYESDQLEYIRTALGQVAPYVKLYQCDDDRYLYIFLKASESSDVVSSALQKALIRAGVEISDTTVGVYPSSASCIPLPLQPGFAWLSPTGQPIMRREEVSLESALAIFVFDAQKSAIDGDFFFDALANEEVQESSTVSGEPATLRTCDLNIAPLDPSVTSLKQNERVIDLRSDLMSLPETLLPSLVELILLQNLATDGRLDKRKTSRAPPSNLRNYVTYRCRSPDSRRSSSGHY